MVNHSTVENVIFTCWEGTEQDAPGAATSHIFPDLPGKLAKRLPGEFGVVLSSEVGLPDPKGNISGIWQVKKAGKVWGVGVKAPKEIAIAIPEFIVMDLTKLFKFLQGDKLDIAAKRSVPIQHQTKEPEKKAT